MPRILLLNGVSFEINADDPHRSKELMESQPEFNALKNDSKLLGLQLEIVPNTDESLVAIVLGRNIAPTFQSIYQGRTIAGDPAAHPLPDEFPSVRSRLKDLIDKHFKVEFTDVGIILSQIG
jgi:hypothetical protein